MSKKEIESQMTQEEEVGFLRQELRDLMLKLPKLEEGINSGDSILVKREYNGINGIAIKKGEEIEIVEIIPSELEHLTTLVKFNILNSDIETQKMSLGIFLNEFCTEMLDKDKRGKTDVKKLEQKIEKLEKAIVIDEEVPETVSEQKENIHHILLKIGKLFLKKKKKKNKKK